MSGACPLRLPIIRAMHGHPRHLAVIGAGYVGLVTGVGLALLGNKVEILEIRPDRLAALRAGRIPIHEAGLQDAFERVSREGRLSVVDALSGQAEMILVCVGTPIGPDGRSDLSQMRSTLGGLAETLPPGVPVVIRSTLPPGGTRMIVKWAGLPRTRVLTNPEFLRQGTALADFMNPSRIVIGRFEGTPASTVAQVEAIFDGIDAPRVVVDVGAAELIKNGANAFLALKLSFTNELANLAEEYGVDIDEVLAGVSLDPRIGANFMRPSFGFGGSCLPKELKALATAGLARGLPMYVTTAASNANAASQRRFVGSIAMAMGGLEGRTIGMLGLAFKAGTDDVRDSPALSVARDLASAGARVVAFDPEAGANAKAAWPEIELASTAAQALVGADAAVVGTEWPEFRALDWAAIGATMRDRLAIDGRRLLDADSLRTAGFRYIAVGSPRVDAEPSEAATEGMEMART
jgi:UDPglucose 6-dehydrogenase